MPGPGRERLGGEPISAPAYRQRKTTGKSPDCRDLQAGGDQCCFRYTEATGDQRHRAGVRQLLRWVRGGIGLIARLDSLIAAPKSCGAAPGFDPLERGGALPTAQAALRPPPQPHPHTPAGAPGRCQSRWTGPQECPPGSIHTPQPPRAGGRGDRPLAG